MFNSLLNSGPLFESLNNLFMKFVISEDLITNKLKDTGVVLSIGDGIAMIVGLHQVKSGELIVFKNKIQGMALNLEKKIVRAVIFGSDSTISQGDNVMRTFTIVEVPVGQWLTGCVVDSLGYRIDNGPVPQQSLYYNVDVKAPGIIPRRSVHEPLQTGLVAIDSMVPIGRGQRELIIGDRQTGKTAIAVDTILNQRRLADAGNMVFCVYVAVGQKRSTVAQIVDRLNKERAMSITVVVAATASDPASLQFLAPYSGCAIAE